MVELITLMIISFLIGSFPTSYIAGKIKGIDIRKYGSKNVGATNAYRVLGPKWAIPILAIDILKGVLSVILAGLFLPWPQDNLLCLGKLLCGVSCVCGHNWTPFLGFKGGKGVATSTGVFFALAPFPMIIVITIFVVIVATTRYVSLGSILSATLLPCIMVITHTEPVIVGFSGLIGIFIILKHTSNIKRLLKGKENRFGQRVRVNQ